MSPIVLKKVIQNTQMISSVFVPTGAQWKSLEAVPLQVRESGPKMLLFQHLITWITAAEQLICLQSYLIQDTAIIDALVTASERGVQVYVMDSAEARLGGNGLEEEEHHSTKDYRTMINTKFRYALVHRQASNFHAKFILIDPSSPAPKGALLTGNFNKKPFEENPELAVELNKGQIEELFQVFVYHFWEYAQHEQTAKEEFEALKPAQQFERPPLKQILLTSPDQPLSNLQATLLAQVEKAKHSIFFSTFGFDIDNAVSKAILAQLEAGVQVLVFCRPREKAMHRNIDVLAAKGALVYCHPLIHAKSMVIDAQWGAVFSANFEKHGMEQGLEAGVVLSSAQKDDLLKVYHNWQQTFPYQFKKEIPIAKLPHQYAQLRKGRLQSFIVQSEENLKPVKKTVVHLKELIAYVEKKPIVKNTKAQKIIQEQTIGFKSIGDLTYSKQQTMVEGVDLVEYQETIKSKKEEKIVTHQVLLFGASIAALNLETTIEQLKKMDLENYKIFMK
ncbi:MAG: phosphatidylserine/phosphatidylglycerophosphate/cardiolipin synthase family protein [Aureispira sp.]